MSSPIARSARVASAACLLGALAIPLGTALVTFSRPAMELFAPLGFASVSHLETWQRLAARAVLTLPSLAGGIAFAVFAGAFRRVGQGAPFDPRVARQLGRFAAVLAVGTVLSALAPTAAGLLLSIHAPADGGRLTVQLGSTHLVGLIATLAVWVFAKLMREAGRLQAENEEFV